MTLLPNEFFRLQFVHWQNKKPIDLSQVMSKACEVWILHTVPAKVNTKRKCLANYFPQWRMVGPNFRWGKGPYQVGIQILLLFLKQKKNMYFNTQISYSSYWIKSQMKIWGKLNMKGVVEYASWPPMFRKVRKPLWSHRYILTKCAYVYAHTCRWILKNVFSSN